MKRICYYSWERMNGLGVTYNSYSAEFKRLFECWTTGALLSLGNFSSVVQQVHCGVQETFGVPHNRCSSEFRRFFE